MIETSGDIWSYTGRAVIVITVNGSLTRDGRAVIGRGVARQAADRYPGLAGCLGTLLSQKGLHVFALGDGVVSFPVEETAWSRPDPQLIARSAQELVAVTDAAGWPLVVLPRPGCGGGGLQWSEVEPLLRPLLDDRFTVITVP